MVAHTGIVPPTDFGESGVLLVGLVESVCAGSLSVRRGCVASLLEILWCLTQLRCWACRMACIDAAVSWFDEKQWEAHRTARAARKSNARQRPFKPSRRDLPRQDERQARIEAPPSPTFLVDVAYSLVDSRGQPGVLQLGLLLLSSAKPSTLSTISSCFH